MSEQSQAHPFNKLTPDFILDAIEALGFYSDGRILTLNSYENRVYQIGIEEQQPIIAKFYRPERWTQEQILEEHEFTTELAESELPVVAPLSLHSKTLFEYDGFYYALYPRKGGHAPELDDLDSLFTLGRFIGRIHALGEIKPYQFRPSLTVETFGQQSFEYLMEHAVPREYHLPYRTLAEDILKEVNRQWQEVGELDYIRTHGDCHIGNILWRDDNPHFVDFDDSRMAPAVQDLWMLLSGERPQKLSQIAEIIEGYEEFQKFPVKQLKLIEPLRTLRMFYHSAWLAKRWSDPAFQQAFPWFDSIRYWEEQILDLRSQFAELQEPTLELPNL
ncbi:serine/threonine protein kinase [Kangiella sp. M94]